VYTSRDYYNVKEGVTEQPHATFTGNVTK